MLKYYGSVSNVYMFPTPNKRFIFIDNVTNDAFDVLLACDMLKFYRIKYDFERPNRHSAIVTIFGQSNIDKAVTYVFKKGFVC